MTSASVPFINIQAEIESVRAELSVAIESVMDGGQFVLGETVSAFEAALGRHVGVPHAIAVNSGTDALVLGMRAAGIVPGDEVITTAFSFFATAEAIETIGARAVLVDIDPATFNLDPAAVEAAITPRTRAILAVHLYGHPADMGSLSELAARHELMLFEDCAQAFDAAIGGRSVGTFGQMAAYSFFPTKNLAAAGDGGAIVCADEALERVARMLRDHGSSTKFQHDMLGYNSRLDAIQAAVLQVKLRQVQRWNSARRQAAQRYHELLDGCEAVVRPIQTADVTHAWNQYSIRLPSACRDAVRDHLTRRGIGCQVYYPIALHQTTYFQRQRRAKPECPQAECAAAEVLSLPMGAWLTESQQQQVADVLREALSSTDSTAAVGC